jgi:hypothetical protein
VQSPPASSFLMDLFLPALPIAIGNSVSSKPRVTSEAVEFVFHGIAMLPASREIGEPEWPVAPIL